MVANLISLPFLFSTLVCARTHVGNPKYVCMYVGRYVCVLCTVSSLSSSVLQKVPTYVVIIVLCFCFSVCCVPCSVNGGVIPSHTWQCPTPSTPSHTRQCPTSSTSSHTWQCPSPSTGVCMYTYACTVYIQYAGMTVVMATCWPEYKLSHQSLCTL